MKPAAASPDLTPKQWEISALLASAVHLADWQPHEASLFQHNQPLSVRRHFTLQALRHCFDAAGVRAATPSGPVPLPDDLLRLIGDYAPIELPYLPLVSVLESARPPNSASAAPPRGAADSPLDACQQRAMAALQAAAIAVLQSPAVAELAVATAVARACGAMDSQWCVLPSVQHWQAQFCELVEDHARSADLMPDRSCVTCLAPISRAQDLCVGYVPGVWCIPLNGCMPVSGASGRPSQPRSDTTRGSFSCLSLWPIRARRPSCSCKGPGKRMGRTWYSAALCRAMTAVRASACY